MLKVCEVCGKEFETENENKVCCNKLCASTRWRRMHPEKCRKNIEPNIGKCIICGKDFEKKRKDHKCCSEECRNEYEKKKVKERYERYKEKQQQEQLKEAVRLAKKGENHDAIADIAIRARNLGMSYGQYVAKYMRNT